MRNFLYTFVLQLLFINAVAEAQMPAVKFESSPTRTALLELYTSEGCSSCPPAETWLSGLKESPRLWRDFVPVAFHVDYWDSLGWKDKWACGEFTERQRAYAQLWRSENIYTPEFVLSGREWHNWFASKNGPASDGEKAGILTVTSIDTNRWQASFAPEKGFASHYEIHAALLAGGIASDVTAGENKGRRLEHDFVVLDLEQIGMTTSNNVARGKFILNVARHRSENTPALAVWVTRPGELEPLQATGGWLGAPAPK